MNPTLPDTTELQARLDKLATEHRVPGATAGVLIDGELTVCATGVARLETELAVRPDSLFLIASITKVWTATLVMQLVDEGLVNLDAPAADYLEPAFRLADTDVARTVTVAQLLAHTGGFFGDAEEPGDRGDDAVRRTVEGYHVLRQLHRPGTLFSYSNAGYNVLGRIVECIRGTTWDEALKTRLLEPLKLEHTFTLPEEIMCRPHVVGHEPKGPDTLELEPVTSWLDPRGSGPCGGTLATTAGDLLGFAALHLRDGRGPDGRQVLSEKSARAMREPRVQQPDPSMVPAWGWGWAIERLRDPLVVEHGGNTCGQESQLVVVPEHGLAVCVLTNGDVEGLLREQLVSEIIHDMVGVDRPRTPEAVDSPVDVSPIVGRYSRNEELVIEVRAEKGTPVADFATSGGAAEIVPSFSSPMVYAGGTSFLLTLPQRTEPIPMTFLHEEEDEEDGATGPASHLALGLRVMPRVTGT